MRTSRTPSSRTQHPSGLPGGAESPGQVFRIRRTLVFVTSFAFALVCAPLAHAQSDPLEPIAALVRRHADDQALAAIARLPETVRRTARTQYLIGRLEERRGRFAEAARAFPHGEAARSLPESVRADSTRRRAVALARSGRCSEARPLLLGMRGPLAQARAAECALAIGELDSAIRELREVVGRGHRDVDLFAARLQLAEALSRAGERDAAIEVLTELVVDRPEHPEAALAVQALEALSGVPIALTREQRMRRAERFRSQRRYDEALAELDQAGRPSDRAELRRWLHLRGMTLFEARRRYAEAAEVLRESASLGGAHAQDDEFHAARALSRADRDRDAVVLYRRFARAHPQHRRAAEALYLAAWLELRHGMRGGERRMRQFVGSAHARRAPRLAREGLWLLALHAFEKGQHRRAIQLFEQYAESDPQTLVRARGLYWLGRAHQAARDRRRAIAAYRRALHVEPLHWYALLARQRLLDLGVDPGSPFPEPPSGASAPPPPATELPEEVTFYAALGLRQDALAALRAQERALRNQGGLRVLVEAYRTLDEPSRLRRLAWSTELVRSRRAPGAADHWRWEAAYPRPWTESVRTAATVVGLTPALLYSVMWQESGFDPDAVSYADAIGLMQLIPPTAERVATQLGFELRREMLFDPATNIRLGAAYIGGLVERLGVPLCFAGFNAGGHRVAAWLEQRGETELDLFVEHIPFEQTRNYVRRVTTHLAHYLYLEEGSGAWPALELPRTVAPLSTAEPEG